MYNRSIPQPDGSFLKQQLTDHLPDSAPQREDPPPILPRMEAKNSSQKEPTLFSELSSGDLMALLTMLLIASEGGENRTMALLTLVFYFLL